MTPSELLNDLEAKAKLVSDLSVTRVESTLGMRRLTFNGGQVLLVQHWRDDRPRDEQEATLDALAEFLSVMSPETVLSVIQYARRGRG